MRVLVTGGAGYIGSHAARTRARRGHQVIIYDDLSTGHRELAHERRNYKLRAASSIEVIVESMQANGLKQKDLVGIFKTASVVSEVLSRAE